ncbi:MAG: hypothetical protein HZB42_11935 [Sphingobacteriales bacterium]|nr:hypothetical protein [Sphingobacteriales bacterium]
MPASLSVISNIKSLKLTALFLLSPLFFFAQSLSGLWVGSLHNDSATVRKDQSFEIALTEYKDKVYGYSRSEFIINDTLYYIVKRVKGTINGDLCEVTDDEIVDYNFRGKLDKGVKVTSTFRRSKTDSSWYLEGTWKTNVTKKYYAVTGKVGLEEEKDLYASKIFPHLEELKLADDVAFYKDFKEKKKEEDEPVIARIVKPERIKSEYNDRAIPLNNDIAITPAKPDLQRAEATPMPAASNPESNEKTAVASEEIKTEQQEELPSVKKPVEALAKTNTNDIPESSVNINPTPVNKKRAETKIPQLLIADNNPQTTVASKPVEQKTVTKSEPVAKTETVKPVNKKTAVDNSNPVSKPVTNVTPVKKQESLTVAINAPVEEKKITKQDAMVAPATPEIKRSEVDIIAKAATISGRKSEFAQVVNFKSDSLELALYDNGVVDGDTVSVFMNGEVLMSKQGLKASAIKKTIYITPGNEDFTLVLYAENLGLYSPNTGLLVVHDGEDTYNLRFSSDFQKSSGIVFRKKK